MTEWNHTSTPPPPLLASWHAQAKPNVISDYLEVKTPYRFKPLQL
jgi:hypothetical protein